MNDPTFEAQWLVVPPSHIGNYLNACKSFTENGRLFETFKQDPAYRVILEHVSYEEGLMFISEMKNPESLNDKTIRNFKDNDIHGSPDKYAYDKFGLISPSTLRYIKNTLDIKQYFEKRQLKNIVEIGGGYGGLCKTLGVLVDFDRYIMIDLPEVNGLSRKYLGEFEELEGRTLQLILEDLDEIEEVDLAISNYAFSEIGLEAQMKYYDLVIKKSRRFYMVYNNFTVGNMNGARFLELAASEFDISGELEHRPPAVNNIFYGCKRSP